MQIRWKPVYPDPLPAQRLSCRIWYSGFPPFTPKSVSCCADFRHAARLRQCKENLRLPKSLFGTRQMPLGVFMSLQKGRGDQTPLTFIPDLLQKQHSVWAEAVRHPEGGEMGLRHSSTKCLWRRGRLLQCYLCYIPLWTVQSAILCSLSFLKKTPKPSGRR